VGLQELRGQHNKVSLAPSVLHGTIEDHVISYQVLPILCVGIES
jgi:hypothetical protein